MMRTIFSSLAVILLVQIGISKTPFLEGHYFDLKNNKVTGLIKYDHRGWFKFKANPNEKPVKVRSNESIGFVINEGGHLRKFETIYNFSLQRGLIKRNIASDFAEVLQEGDLIFYRHRCLDAIFDLKGDPIVVVGRTNFFIDDFFIRKGKDGIIYNIPQYGNKKLAKVMLPLIKDNTELVRKFEANQISVEVIEEVVKTYNNSTS